MLAEPGSIVKANTQEIDEEKVLVGVAHLSEEDPRVSLRLWSGVRVFLEWAELGVGGPP